MAKRPSTPKTAAAKNKDSKRKAAKSKAVKKTAGKRKVAKKRAQKKPPAKVALIPADSADYPGYTLTFEGSLIVDPPQIVRGTHTFFGMATNSRMKYSLLHNSTDDVPNLTILVEPEE